MFCSGAWSESYLSWLENLSKKTSFLDSGHSSGSFLGLPLSSST